MSRPPSPAVPRSRVEEGPGPVAARPRGSRTSKPSRRSRRSRRTKAVPSVRRARLLVLGAAVVSAGVLVAWFPAASLLHQRASLASDVAQLATLHQQDAALTQEQKNLSDTGEIGRIARAQYQLVSPGQQAYEVLPPSDATAAGTPYAGDPGSDGPVTPSATSELPPGGVTTTTAPPSGVSAHASGHGNTAQGRGGGILSRMVQALEFWR